MRRPRYFQDTDDPFICIRKIFVDYGYCTIINCYNRLIFTFHTCSMLLESYHIVTNFSLVFFTQYGGATILMLYFLITLFFTIVNQDLFQQTLEESKSFFWNMDFLPVTMQKQILKEMTQTKRKIYFFWIWTVLFGIVMLPVWGNYNEAHLFPQIYDRYFGYWSPVFYYFYVSTFPFAAYSGIRLAAIALYIVLELKFQTRLLNQKILQISQECRHQNEIFQNLCSCISHHWALKKSVAKLLKWAQKTVPVYFCLAVLCLITVMFVTLNNLGMSTSTHLKARFLVAGIYGGTILYTFAEAGQVLTDTTGEVFNTLMQCPWYKWDLKNRKIFTMFLQYSLKPLQVVSAGIVVDYSFGSSVVKTCCSYALVLYQMRNDD